MFNIHQILNRLFDILFASVFLVIISPLYILIYTTVYFVDGSPVIYRQDRLGKNERPFSIFKFRTMRVGADKESQGLFSSSKDPRITRLGLFLRRNSLDELPQFMNVLLGDMSIVGPRPAVVNELDTEIVPKNYKKRFKVKPGLTGLSQISGRNNLTWEEKIRYDLRYLMLKNKYDIMIDLYIIIMTIVVVLNKKGSIENG
jgi:lipopolysaccharide/colanic/teichoic acid biosynthesis glycosyltransferase